jgi:hypothetical protein
MVLARHSGIKLARTETGLRRREFWPLLDVASAQAIGPPRLPARSGGTDLRAALRLRRPHSFRRKTIYPDESHARLVNLALTPDFEELFLANLYLEPLKED